MTGKEEARCLPFRPFPIKFLSMRPRPMLWGVTYGLNLGISYRSSAFRNESALGCISCCSVIIPGRAGALAGRTLFLAGGSCKGWGSRSTNLVLPGVFSGGGPMGSAGTLPGGGPGGSGTLPFWPPSGGPAISGTLPFWPPGGGPAGSGTVPSWPPGGGPGGSGTLPTLLFQGAGGRRNCSAGVRGAAAWARLAQAQGGSGCTGCSRSGTGAELF